MVLDKKTHHIFKSTRGYGNQSIKAVFDCIVLLYHFPGQMILCSLEDLTFAIQNIKNLLDQFTGPWVTLLSQ